ncbi:hypothetical protein [Kitasatospora terrestris]
MTAPGSLAPAPGRSAVADRRPAVVLWSLLLVGLLALLPCAGNARALSAHHPASSARADRPAGPAQHALHHAAVAVVDADGNPLVWCAADGEHPLPGSGCSSHAFCGPEAQLPNAPPQPAAVTLPRLVAPAGLSCGPPPAPPSGPDHAPDLHVLQVHRS